MELTKKPMLDAVRGIKQTRPPVWIMRQAGRYLPEYRKIRQSVSGFLELCYTPKLASQVTLQPLKRFDLDAAIIFSDILVVPKALGQNLWFAEGEGPRLDPLDLKGIEGLSRIDFLQNLSAIFETIDRVKTELDSNVSLIGFCGAPWTVATYMLAGKGSPDQAQARLFALQEPKAFKTLIDLLVDVSIDYLIAQFRAGVDVVQIFESWALNLDETSFKEVVIAPNQRIVDGVRKVIPNAPIIGFPRGAAGMLRQYQLETKVSMLGLDYAVPLDFVKQHFPSDVGVQGNLDPLRLVAGGGQMSERVDEIIAGFSERPHVFNLGHGIVPQTPISHVEQLVNEVKGI